MNKKEILLQPNNLIKSRYEFTPIENKLFYKILYNAQKQSNNKPIYHATIKTDEFKEFIKNKNECTEASIKTMLNLFQTSILEFDYIDDNGGLRTFGSGLINTYDLNHAENSYEITLHETLYKHITDFISMQGRGYTALNMSLFFTFKGAYTQRFYTLMRLWSRQDTEVEIRYTLEELRTMLKLKTSVYPEYKAFKQNVIKRALKEINEKGNMKVEIKEELRKSRKVETIVFSVIDYEPRKYFDKKDNIKVIEQKENGNNKEFDTTEAFEVENNTNIVYTVKETLKIENKEFYIPDEDVFTKGTLRLFKKDFKEYNFKEQILNDAFEDALAITFEKDDVEIIETKSYKYFKGSLENKIQEYRAEHQADEKHKEEMDKYWN